LYPREKSRNVIGLFAHCRYRLTANELVIPASGIQTIEPFWIAAYATMTKEVKLVRHSGRRAGIQAIGILDSRLRGYDIASGPESRRLNRSGLRRAPQ